MLTARCWQLLSCRELSRLLFGRHNRVDDCRGSWERHDGRQCGTIRLRGSKMFRRHQTEMFPLHSAHRPEGQSYPTTPRTNRRQRLIAVVSLEPRRLEVAADEDLPHIA